MHRGLKLIGAAFVVATLSACLPTEGMQPDTLVAKPGAQPEPKPVAKAEAKPVAKAEAKPVAKAEAKPVAKAEAKPVAKAETKPVAKAETKPVAKVETKPVAKAEAKPVVKAGWRSRQVDDLNGLEASARSHMVGRIVRAASRDAKSSAAAYNDASLNAGVTQTTRDSQNVVISAHYDGGELVFVQQSGPTSRAMSTNALAEVFSEVFYSSAIPSEAGLPWKGVESSFKTRRGGIYRLLHLSDIENNDDKDYMALGLWTWTDGRRAFAGTGASGNDPFDAAKLETLRQMSGYAGHAVGVYGTEDAGIQLFTADVRLTVNFGEGNVSGLLTNGKDKATGAGIFTNLKLNSISLDVFFNGSLAGENVAGKWGGQFFGKGADGELPGSIGGTFGVAASDKSGGLMGTFGVHRQ